MPSTATLSLKKMIPVKRILLYLLIPFFTSLWSGCETKTENSADTYPDSDGDGVYDFVEIALGTDPFSSSDSPEAKGMLYTVYTNDGKPSKVSLDFTCVSPSAKAEYTPIDISVSIIDGDTGDGFDPIPMFIENVQGIASTGQVLSDYNHDGILDCFLDVTPGEICNFKVNFKIRSILRCRQIQSFTV